MTGAVRDALPEAVSTCPHFEAGEEHYVLGDAELGRSKLACRSCAFRYRPVLMRSLRVALVVGTFLVLLNQSDKLFGAEPLPADLWWRIPLTYCVPFAVATYGALSNARRVPGN